jgi:CRP-like cAMP-binding protein
LGNLLGGVVLQLDRSIQVGDWVKVDDVSGRVVEIGWRHTAIETRNRETVVVPNGWLVKNRFTVIGSRADAKPLWRRWVHFDVALDAPPLAVCEVLARGVNDARIAHVAADPAASAVLLKVGDGFGHFGLRYFLDDPLPDDVTDTLVRAHALAALAREGLSLAVTREERLLIKDNEAHRGAALERELVRRRDALARVDLFSALSADERAALAQHLTHAPFVAGDVITRQGAVAHWLYLILSGEADVWVEAGVERTFIRTLGAGQLFGEMGLMTGQPRAATVTARTDVECYRVDKTGFERILRSRPDIAAAMASILAEREQERAERVQSAATTARRPAADSDILASIRGFFGLDR